MPTLVRAIGRWSLTALTINCIIGSGVFGLPSVLAGSLGTASLFAWLFAAVATGLVMACFAEVASRFDQSGGVYLYSRTAFGRAAKSLRVDQWLLWASWETSGAGVRGTVTLAGPIAFALPPRSAHRPKGRIPICIWREPLVLVVVLVLGIRDRAVEDEDEKEDDWVAAPPRCALARRTGPRTQGRLKTSLPLK